MRNYWKVYSLLMMAVTEGLVRQAFDAGLWLPLSVVVVCGAVFVNHLTVEVR